MVRARFTGPPNPDPDGNDLGHEIAMFGRRVVRADDLVEVPGDLLEEQADAWLMGDPADDDKRYVLPKALWQVEDQPTRRSKPAAAAAARSGE